VSKISNRLEIDYEEPERPVYDAFQNWEKAKFALLRRIRVSRLMRGARENKNLRTENISEIKFNKQTK
jgi:hypothetical protein